VGIASTDCGITAQAGSNSHLGSSAGRSGKGGSGLAVGDALTVARAAANTIVNATTRLNERQIFVILILISPSISYNSSIVATQ
jgi:hypothetical protein